MGHAGRFRFFVAPASCRHPVLMNLSGARPRMTCRGCTSPRASSRFEAVIPRPDRGPQRVPLLRVLGLEGRGICSSPLRCNYRGGLSFWCEVLASF